MKVKHIISTCGILLGGVAMAQAASAVVTYKTSTDVQFTFNSTLNLTVSDNFTITDLAPGTADNSNTVDITVGTNSSAGYTLSAKVGNTTYNNTSLTRTANSTLDTNNVFTMTAGGASTLAAGTWGYLLNSATNYAALSTSDTVINKTTNKAGTGATGYDGDSGNGVTKMKIGANADSTQRSGDYKNVITFTAMANMDVHTVTVAAGTNVASVTPATAASYDNGSVINITATCSSDYAFTQWVNSTEYGTVADPSSASTTFTVGPHDTTLTAYCNATSS